MKPEIGIYNIFITYYKLLMANVNPKLDFFKESILKHNANVFLPKEKPDFVKHETNSCFTINIHTDQTQDIKNINFVEDENIKKDLYSAQYINLFFNGKEKNIIDKWLDCCIETTNITIDFFKTLMTDRISTIHRKKVLLSIRNKVSKELYETKLALKEDVHNRNLNENLKHLNKTLSNIDEKIVINKKNLLNALKKEKIYWLSKTIEDVEKKDNYVQPTISELESLDYWKNLSEKNIKSYKLNIFLKYSKDLKEKLMRPNYFKEIEEKNNNLESLLETYNSLKKENTKKILNIKNTNNKINKEIKKINDEIKKIKYEYLPDFTFQNIRDVLNEKIFAIINKSQLFNDNETKIRKHILDESVHQVCTNIKSMLENYSNGNIKGFKLRKIKMNKTSKNLILENAFFKPGSIFKKIFKDMKCEKNGKPYDILNVFNQKTSCNLVHDYTTNTYKLFIPQKVIKQETQNNKSLSGDLGIRTFLTGISDNEILEIGISSEMDIKKMVEKIIKLKNPSMKIRNKQKKIKKLRKDVANKVDELHWKTIKFITKNYKTVVIGDINVKSIVRKEGNLSNFNKDLIHALSIYKFKQRLKYKCECMGLKFYMPDEYGTSKLCSCCGSYNDVKESKHYKCKTCKLQIDRDVNSARSIMMLKMK
jgi:IS605 OrfB family transposase